jgi:hypothetical protein
MSNINEVQSQKFIEAESKKFNSEIKQLRSENDRNYESESKSKEAQMQRMHDDYDTKIANLKNDQEQKLVEIRNRQNKSVNEETIRLQVEVANLKKSHQDQLSEIKSGQQNEIQTLVESHKKTIDNAKQKFLKEKNKFNG